MQSHNRLNKKMHMLIYIDRKMVETYNAARDSFDLQLIYIESVLNSQLFLLL